MGEDTGSWHPQQKRHLQSPNLDSLNAPSLMGHSFINSMRTDAGATNMVSSAGEGSPAYAFPELPHLRISQFNQPHGWFYCLPRFRQAFTPGLNSAVPRDKAPLPAYGICNVTGLSPASREARKKFLVFDQSGDQMTLMVNSGIGTPFRCITSWSLEHLNLPRIKDEVCGPKADPCPHFGAMWKNDTEEIDMSDSPSEMHEDSEELNALLYSSDDEDDVSYCSGDDEVTSTGHSPSTMTTQERRSSEESVDEVASSAWPTRKRKLFNGARDNAAPLDDTASSGYSMNHFTENLYDEDNDAQSSCAKETGLIASHKRIRRERIRETVSILQEMIPGGKGKDAVVVLDEAIHYLKSLKVRVKSLGPATF